MSRVKKRQTPDTTWGTVSGAEASGWLTNEDTSSTRRVKRERADG